MNKNEEIKFQRLCNMSFQKVYGLLITKAVRKKIHKSFGDEIEVTLRER